MELITFPSSPFGKKVCAVADACGIFDKIKIVEFYPWVPGPELRNLNPLNKIPVLKIGDESIYDSGVICEYLIEVSGAKNLMPNRMSTLKIQALMDGILDAALLMRYEKFFRPQHLQSIDWYNRQHFAMSSGLSYLNYNVQKILNNDLTFANICVSVSLAYLQLRFCDESWERDYENLYSWCENYFKVHEFLKNHKPAHKTPPSDAICIQQ